MRPQADFDDPRQEWRRLFAELFGTFLLVLVAAGADVVNAQSNGGIGRTAAVAAPGLMVMAIILFMGAVSGAHLNPAVSIAFAARRDFPWARVPGYILAQLAGATLACLLLWAMLGKVGSLGATVPGPGIGDGQAMLMELVLTVGLVSTVLGTASGAQNVGALGAVGVGSFPSVSPGFCAAQAVGPSGQSRPRARCAPFSALPARAPHRAEDPTDRRRAARPLFFRGGHRSSLGTPVCPVRTCSDVSSAWTRDQRAPRVPRSRVPCASAPPSSRERRSHCDHKRAAAPKEES